MRKKTYQLQFISAFVIVSHAFSDKEFHTFLFRFSFFFLLNNIMRMYIMRQSEKRRRRAEKMRERKKKITIKIRLSLMCATRPLKKKAKQTRLQINEK